MIKKPLIFLFLYAAFSYSYIDSLFLDYVPPLWILNSLAFSPELSGNFSGSSGENSHLSESSRLFLAHRYEYESRKYQIASANNLLLTLEWGRNISQTTSMASGGLDLKGNIDFSTNDTLRCYMKKQFFTEFDIDYHILPIAFYRRDNTTKNLEILYNHFPSQMVYYYHHHSLYSQAITNDLSISFGAGKGRIENVTAVACAKSVLGALEKDSVLKNSSTETKAGLADLIVRLSARSPFDWRDKRRLDMDSIGSYLVSHGLCASLPVKTVVNMVDAYDYFNLQPRHRGFRTGLLPYFCFFEQYDSLYDNSKEGKDTLHISSFPSCIMDLALPDSLHYEMYRGGSESRHIQYGASAYAVFARPLSDRSQFYLNGDLAWGVYYMYPFSEGFHYQYPVLTGSASAVLKLYPNFRSTITQTLTAGYERHFAYLDFNGEEKPDLDFRNTMAAYSLSADYYLSSKFSLSGMFSLNYYDKYDLDEFSGPSPAAADRQWNSSLSANANYYIF